MERVRIQTVKISHPMIISYGVDVNIDFFVNKWLLRN